jgi:hypothetical protein
MAAALPFVPMLREKTLAETWRDSISRVSAEDREWAIKVLDHSGLFVHSDTYNALCRMAGREEIAPPNRLKGARFGARHYA